MSDKEMLNQDEWQEEELCYWEELLDYIRVKTTDNREISALEDDDIDYILGVWSEFLEVESVDTDDEILEIDPLELYAYLEEALREDDRSLKVSQEAVVTLAELEQEFADTYLESDDDE